MWFDFLLFSYSSSEKWLCACVLGTAKVPHGFHPTWLPVHKALLEHCEFPDLRAKRGTIKLIVLWLLPVESPWENSPHSGVSISSENRHTCEYQSHASSQHLSILLWRDWNVMFIFLKMEIIFVFYQQDQFWELEGLIKGSMDL